MKVTGGFAAAAHHDPIAGPIGSLGAPLGPAQSPSKRPSAAGTFQHRTYFRTLVIVHALLRAGCSAGLRRSPVVATRAF